MLFLRFPQSLHPFQLGASKHESMKLYFVLIIQILVDICMHGRYDGMCRAELNDGALGRAVVFAVMNLWVSQQTFSCPAVWLPTSQGRLRVRWSMSGSVGSRDVVAPRFFTMKMKLNHISLIFSLPINLPYLLPPANIVDTRQQSVAMSCDDACALVIVTAVIVVVLKWMLASERLRQAG